MRRVAQGAPPALLGLPPVRRRSRSPRSRRPSSRCSGGTATAHGARIAPARTSTVSPRRWPAMLRGRARRRPDRVRDRAARVAAAALPAARRAWRAARRRPCWRRRRDRDVRADEPTRALGGSRSRSLTDGAALLADDSVDGAPRNGSSRSPGPTLVVADRTLRGRRGGGRARGGRVRRPRCGRARGRRVAGPGGPDRAARRAPAAAPRYSGSARPSRRPGRRAPWRPDFTPVRHWPTRDRLVAAPFATPGRRGLRSSRGEAGQRKG